jgi:methylenetetrahydrofolate dehydrogenase (NADP+)/methenyltetrahydrofolate cyclohydrolase
MTAQILDGRALSSIIKNNISQIIKQRSPIPGLDVILVGNDPASEIYVAHKQSACKRVGIKSTLHKLPLDVSEQQLIAMVDELNAAPDVHGILIQLPLPHHLHKQEILERIAPHKDVDGFHPYNLGRLMLRNPTLRPCTPFGIIKLFHHYNIETQGKHAVIIGASNIVGRPLSIEMLLAKSTVTICHRFTEKLEAHVKTADILISATGSCNIIKTEWIKPGAVVVDVGITRLPDGGLCGDIDFASAKERASWITPVPGGVGPMTVATLLENTLKAAYGNWQEEGESLV